MSVGVYASIYPKSTVTLRYGTASASWVNTTMDSNPTVLFIGKKSSLNPVGKVAHTHPTGFENDVYLRESNEFTPMIWPQDFEDEALSALMEEAFSQTEEETKFWCWRIFSTQT